VPQARYAVPPSQRLPSPCAKRAPSVCTAPASSASSEGSVTPPDDHARQVGAAGERDIVAGRPLSQVAIRAPQAPRRAARITIAASFHTAAVHHARRALRAPVAGIRAGGGKGKALRLANGFGRGAHQQADFPMAGVVAERDRPAVLAAQASLRAEDQERGARCLARVPAHAGVLREAEEVAARRPQQQLGLERQASGRAFGVRAHRARIATEDL
jgi:hypothetical protein